MSSSQGWIKLHRDIREHWVWKDPLLLKIWIDILMSANHEDKKINVKGKIIVVHRGQFWTSGEVLAERWGISRKTVLRKLNLLKSDGMIMTDSVRNNGTMISISNYGQYQDFSDPSCTADDTASDTSNDTNAAQHSTHEQELLRMNKNEEEKRAPVPDCDPWGHKFQ